MPSLTRKLKHRCSASDDINGSITLNERIPSFQTAIATNTSVDSAAINAEQSPAKPLSVAHRNEPLKLSVQIQALGNLVANKLQEYEDKFQEYEIDNAELRKQFNDKVAESKMQKIQYEAEIVELKQEIQETKKKQWCQNCFNEVTFDCSIFPPACSRSCLDKLW